MLTNYDLMEISKNNKVAIDEINYKDKLKSIKSIKNKNKNVNVIINLQNSTSYGNGTHWVCLVKRGNHFFYFDSFGATPPRVVVDYCEKISNIGLLAMNNYIIQNLNTDVCGYYCFALLHYLKNTTEKNLFEKANEFINIFEDDTKNNEKILFKYFKYKKIKI